MDGYQTPLMRLQSMLAWNMGDNTHNQMKQAGYGNEQDFYNYMKALNAFQAKQQESHALGMTPQQRVNDLRKQGNDSGGGISQLLPLMLMAMG